MASVRYREFRLYKARRQEANNAMMALLAGSKLAVSTLTLTAGSTLRLSEIFPRVPHIKRFDLRTDAAERILEDAESHLSVMAIPYVLALHEGYMVHCDSMLAEAGLMSRDVYRRLTPKTMHERFAAAANRGLDPDALSLFHVLRTMRNSHIHQGGLASKELIDARGALTPGAEGLWLKLNQETPPRWEPGDYVSLGQRELVTCLAITDHLAEDANSVLRAVLPMNLWASHAVNDALEDGRGVTGNPNQRFRSVRGFVRMHYEALGIPESDLRTAVRDAGIDA